MLSSILKRKIKEIVDKSEELEEYLEVEDSFHTLYEVTNKEWEDTKEWRDKHIEEEHGGSHYAGAIGGRFTYKFTSTSIGTVGVVECSCGAEYKFKTIS